MIKMSVIMICGAPASGKSTLVKSLLNSKTIYLSRDKEGGNVSDLLPKLEKSLQNKEDVVLDNLFTTIDSRKPFIDLCKKYNTDISCEYMTTSIEDCTFNAVQRSFSLIGKFPSPEEIRSAKHPNIFPPAVLFKYKKEHQKPTVAEGFSKINEHSFSRKDDPSFVNKALILDYDGTLRECVGGNGKYPVSEDQIVIKDNVKNKLLDFKNKGYILLGVSNQSGVHKGDLTYEKCCELFDHTNKLLGVDIDYKFCPHQSAPISCYCRKPQTGTFVEFMLKYKLDRKQCLMVGDMTSDKTMATRAGIKYYDQAEFFK